MKIEIKCQTGFESNLEDLKPFQGNLKDLSQENYEKLKTEILTQGFSAPFFVWNGFILDGHQRLRVLQKMKSEGVEIPFLPIVPIHAADEAEAKRKLLSFASQYGEVTKQGLYEFMQTSNIEFDEMDARFRFPEIKNEDFEEEFYKEPAIEGEDDVPESRATDIKLGNIYNLGRHRLLCGDATSTADVNALMNGEKADMVFTDPPYGIAYHDNTPEKRRIENDNLDPYLFIEFIKNTLQNAYDYTSNGPVYMWFATGMVKEIIQAVETLYTVKNWIIWTKDCGSRNMTADYRWKFEPCLYLIKDRKKLPEFYGDTATASNVWDVPDPKSFAAKTDAGNPAMNNQAFNFHPNQKPTELARIAIENSSNKNGMILDLFGGSGSTLIACEKTNRKCFMMEIDPQYTQVIIDRWEKFTGQKAEKLN